MKARSTTGEITAEQARRWRLPTPTTGIVSNIGAFSLPQLPDPDISPMSGILQRMLADLPMRVARTRDVYQLPEDGSAAEIQPTAASGPGALGNR